MINTDDIQKNTRDEDGKIIPAFLFFDLDGTILDLKEGILPSTKEAITLLKEKGHLPMICTGRSPSFLPKEVIDMDFVGWVASAGAYLSYNGNCFYNYEIPQEEVAHALNVLRDNHMVPLLEGWDYLYFDKDEYTGEVNSYRDLLLEQIGEKWQPITGNEGNIHMNKISAKLLENATEEAAMKKLGGMYDYIVHGKKKVGTTVELIPNAISKGTGIERMKTFLQMEDALTFAFGDSDNDIPMFEAVDYKVAMGNGNAHIKELADYVTDTRENDGIVKALQYLKMIG